MLPGMPKECTVLTLLKPISGGGGLAMGGEIIRRCGTDSYAGRGRSDVGSSETSLYTTSVPWFEPNQIRCSWQALCGDLAAFTASVVLARLYFPYS